MKVKLLKKIRKRFSWYYNKNDNIVLTDHIKRTVIFIDIPYIIKNSNYTLDDPPESGWKITKERFLKEIIHRPFKYTSVIEELLYRYSSYKANRKIKK